MNNLSLHPPLEPFEQGYLEEKEGHLVYYELSGNPNGQPVLFVHGGPGGRSEPKHRQYFSPEKYLIILFDQRGCGNSVAKDRFSHNTTFTLVCDMERLREKLSIRSWILFGGSWGSTLCLAYAILHRENVCKLILRGVFLGTHKEIAWFTQDGASLFYPEQYEQFKAFCPKERQEAILEYYHEALFSNKHILSDKAGRLWCFWELCLCLLQPDFSLIKEMVDSTSAVEQAKMEAHYFLHHCFLEDNWIETHLHKISKLPTTIIQGRYDLLTPPQAAYKVASNLEDCTLFWSDKAGHASSEPETLQRLLSIMS